MINDTHTYICVRMCSSSSFCSTVITVATRQSCSRFDPVAKGAHAWIIAIAMKVFVTSFQHVLYFMYYTVP